MDMHGIVYAWDAYTKEGRHSAIEFRCDKFHLIGFTSALLKRIPE